jgi:hypothetical protein
MIRLITVIGHGTNLIKHHIEHYSKYVDEINYVVYDTDERPRLHEEVQDIICEHVNVNLVRIEYNRIFDWDKVTELYNYVTNKHPNDWWVIADIDEFHIYPKNNLRELISDCDSNGWEIVRGGFIDRIGGGGEFVELNDNGTIWEQFPCAGFFRYPLSNACPNKICVIKGHIEITSGQHYAKINDMTTWRFQGWNHPLIAPYETHSVQVHHFKWDKSAINRIKSVADLNEKYAYSDEYKLMYKNLEKTGFRIDLRDERFMFETLTWEPNYNNYKQWNKLIKQIVSI